MEVRRSVGGLLQASAHHGRACFEETSHVHPTDQRSALCDAVVMSNPPEAASAPTVARLVGVYDADGSLRGELAYWVGAGLGRAHCSLCDITHGRVRERTDWKACRAELPVRFDTFHRDDQPTAVRSALGGVLPAVVAETAAGVVLLLGPDELAACDGSTSRLTAAIEDAVARAGLGWPT